MFDRINDPIFGIIKVNNIEANIINTPIFQRLRYLKQLGMAYYVYPTAIHDRFSHSLGVLFLANKIGLVLNEKKKNLIDKDTLNNLRMAALLHDIGHFPFSHALELTEEDHSKIKLPDFLIKGHEILTTFIIKNSYLHQILENNGYNCDLICSLISRETTEDLILSNIIHWELDADRLDYLLRDSYFTGLKYGSLDYLYLIENFGISSYEDRDILVIDEKASRAIEDILIGRYSLYDRVYTHKNITYYDFLLKSLFLYYIEDLLPDFLKNEENFKEIITNEENSKLFFEFSDGFIFQKLYEKYKILLKEQDQSNLIKNLKFDLNSVLFRNKNDNIWQKQWGTLKADKDCNLRTEKIKNIIKNIEPSYENIESNIKLNIPNNKFTKYKTYNYSSFGFEFTNLKEINEERLESIMIIDKNECKHLFFEWNQSYFKNIFNHKNIKVNIYMKNYDTDLIIKFKNQEKEILDYLTD